MTLAAVRTLTESWDQIRRIPVRANRGMKIYLGYNTTYVVAVIWVGSDHDILSSNYSVHY